MHRQRVFIFAVCIALSAALCFFLNGLRALAATSLWLAVLVHVLWNAVFLATAASLGGTYSTREHRTKFFVAALAAPLLFASALAWSLLLFGGAVALESWAQAQGGVALELVRPIARMATAQFSLFAVGYALMCLLLFGQSRHGLRRTAVAATGEA